MANWLYIALAVVRYYRFLERKERLFQNRNLFSQLRFFFLFWFAKGTALKMTRF